MNDAMDERVIPDRRSIDPTRPNWMEIDLRALDHNFGVIRAMVGPDVRIIPCVKSAAFGHGLVELSQRLVELGARTIFCGSCADAGMLRRAGLDRPDLVIFGSTLPAGIPALLRLGLIPTVHQLELAEAVSSAATGPTRVYVKVDSGRGRLGLPIRTAEDTILSIARMPNIVIEGLYTHLPFADAEGAAFARERTRRFGDLVGRLRARGLDIPVTQARSSSGILYGIEDGCNAVAPGSLLFGKTSLPLAMADVSGLRPVLSAVRTRIIHLSADAADRTPGTALRYADLVTGPTGVVPFGRADGHPVAAPGRSAFALVKGVKAPVLSVSSEQAVLDLSDVPYPAVGDEVTILGADGGLAITLADLAGWQGSSMNDVLLMMRGRTPLLFIER
ncbi:alanine racemase [Labrys wisconsinensis]|uniref:alanine racemase n=1 Tax=Labrys wisconsinensis TaxID=425677 RepID=A0ABU0JGQ2_9HYPH|nr:alanine racemase [Labrys wisconsinensis]MDQ0472651.1 alanine racemase [Labrys wisconsinensis]